jgi:hypothetical protein
MAAHYDDDIERGQGQHEYNRKVDRNRVQLFEWEHRLILMELDFCGEKIRGGFRT